MKYFIGVLNNSAGAHTDLLHLSDSIIFGIPAEQTERIIPVNREQTNIVEYENTQTFISVPALFHRNEIPSPHGLVLKTGQINSTNKLILLSPKIDSDREIPEESICPLPKVFSGLFPFVRGVFFIDQTMILVLDPAKLPEMLS